MSKFDQIEGQPYGKCNDCGVELIDKNAASAHTTETFEAAKVKGVGQSSHGVRVQNDTRDGRIKSGVSQVVEDAITDAVDELWRLVDSGDATEEEVTAGLAFHSEFQDAWEEAVSES